MTGQAIPQPPLVNRDAWSVLLLATVAAAATLRFMGLQSGLWYDEITSLVLSIRHPVGQIVTEFPGPNLHPLYNVLAHLSIQTFGESAWALRLPACLFGIASVVMVYALGTQVMSRVEAWAAAAVLATSYHHIWFSQNARGYTLMGFLALVSTHALLRAGGTDRRGGYVIYALASLAGIYANLTMAFVVVGQAAAMVAGRAFRWRPASQPALGTLLWVWAAIAVLSVVAYAPMVGKLLAVVSAPRPAAQVATASWAMGETIRSAVSGAGAPGALAAAVFAVIGAVVVYRGHPLACALLLMPGVVTGAAMVALHQPIRPRFFFFLSGAAAIFVGRGIGAAVEAIVRRRAVRSGAPAAGVIVCTIALAALSTTALPRYYRVPKQDFDGAVRLLDDAEAGGTRIAAAGPACLPLAIYYDKASWRCLKSVDDWQDVRGAAHSVLVVYTLAEYIDAPVSERLRLDCPMVQRFEGTLGGGDIIVCKAR